MKKTGTVAKGGIQKKYLRLILIVIAMVVSVFVIMNLVQVVRLSTIVRDTSAQQKAVISSFSEGTLETMVTRRLSHTVEMEAENMVDLFVNCSGDVMALADYTEKLFENPENFVPRDVPTPDACTDGEYSVQLITEEGIDINSPAVKEKARLLGSLTDCMLAFSKDITAEPEELIENVAKGIDAFVDGAEQFDDITMLCFRYNGPS